MENIDSILKSLPAVPSQSAKEVAAKEALGLVFKDIMSSLIKDDETEDGFIKDEEEKATSSGAIPNLSAYSEQIVDYLLNSIQGKQIVADINNRSTK